MTLTSFIIVEVLVIAFLGLIGLIRYAGNQSNIISKYTMTILLDEFLYRQERIRFLKLIETLKVENSAILFQAAMFDLQDAVMKNLTARNIGPRMWQINQRALISGESAATILESGGVILGNTDPQYPLRDQNVAISRAHFKFRKKIRETHAYLRRLFGF